MEQDLTMIQNFNVLPEQSLALLGQKLGLRMSRTELLYCTRHYKGRGNGDISVAALRLIDALACPESITLDKIAIGELLTDHDYLADTFADAVSKLKALGKSPEKPFTMQDIAELSVRYTTAVYQTDMAEPIGFGGTTAQYAAQGFGVRMPIQTDKLRMDALQPLARKPGSHAAYADALVLLCPAANVSPDAFDQTIESILYSELGQKIHCVCNTAQESVAHALVRISTGAVLNLSVLPEQLDDPQALAVPCTGLLLALPQDAAPALILQAAQFPALNAYELGIVDHAGYLIVKNGKDTLLAQDVSYLKSICFIRSYTLRLEDKTADALPVTMPLCIPDKLCERMCNAAYAQETSFRAAVLCAMRAYCTAVAAGCDPKRIWLDARVLQEKHHSVANAAGDLLCTLLGLYRFSMELGVPVRTHPSLVPEESSIVTLASAPADTRIPQKLQGAGKIYLLAPASAQDGMPVYSELRALISYLHRAMRKGTVKSARFVCGNTPADVLTEAAEGAYDVIFNPHNTQVLQTPCPCGFLVETDQALAGELIAVSLLPEQTQNDGDSDNIS